MKKWAFMLVLGLVLNQAAGCISNTGEPVSWQVANVCGKALQVKQGTRAWHKVTIKNTGGTKAEQVELRFNMPGLMEYGDDVPVVYPRQSFTISDPLRTYENSDFIRYLYNYEGDGTVIITWREKGVKKSQRIAYTGKYHPKEPSTDKPSLHFKEKGMQLSLSPQADLLVQSAGRGLSFYRLPNETAPNPIWNSSDPYYWGSSNILWSADGKKFLFTSTSYAHDNWNEKRDSLGLADLQKQSAQIILENKSFLSQQWSPDGRYILIKCIDDQQTGSNDGLVHMLDAAVWLYDTQTTSLKRLIRGGLMKILWSPDSRYLTYDATGGETGFSLSLYDLQKGQSRQIAVTETPYDPQAWSRDGKCIYYETGSFGCDDMGPNQLGYFDLAACEDHRLTNENPDSSMIYFLSISPDEKTLLFLDGSYPESELWQMNMKTGARQKIQTASSIQQVFWTADCRQYYYFARMNNSADGQGSVWQVNVNQPQAKKLKQGLVQLQQMNNNQLYIIEKKPTGLLYEYSLLAIHTKSGQYRTVKRLPEYTPVTENATGAAKFSFILRYGVEARNELNTQAGTFRKDLIVAGSITSKLKLADQELQEIQKDMASMNIVAYPDIFDEKLHMKQMPYITYDLTIQYNGKSQHILWRDCGSSQSKQAVQLRTLCNKIIKMIEGKPEYKKMPPVKGAYL